MSDYKAIYLQPECCADPDTGRLWCQDPDPEDCQEDCPEKKEWTKYIRADLAAAPELLEALKAVIEDLRIRAEVRDGQRVLDISNGILIQAEKAIAKATEEQ